MERNWETVHTIHDYYDGPRSGATELNGETYWYRSLYLDGEWNSTDDRFGLTPLSSELLVSELERDAIFARWDEARKDGIITWLAGDENSFGALPDEMPHYCELNTRVDSFLANATPAHLARSHFSPDAKLVQWELIEG